MRRATRFLFLPLLVTALLASGCRHSRPAPAAAANLLLITLDTTRADRLGCYGDPRAVTPALDSLARAGVLFANCYAPAPLTLPAHCSLFTGRWPIAHGVRNNGSYALPANETTLAEALQAAGYDTAALIAAYVLKGKYGLDQGFAWYEDRLGASEEPGDADAEIPAERVYAKFRNWLGRPRRRPFFLWVHLYDPHKPYAPPPEFLQAVGNDPYRGEVACADHAVGRMLADLRARGLLERTLVVAAGDHGEGFGEHGERGHGIFCYEESVRVPLVFSGAGLPRRALRVVQRARLIDVMPTVLDLMGVPVPGACQGASLAGLLAGKEEKGLRPVLLESLYGRELNNWAPLTALISGRQKYVSLPRPELYDLASDPGETDNLFLRRNAEARRLDGELAAFIVAHRNSGAAAGRSLDAGERRKLEALGYVSGFAASGRSSLDPKEGIVFQERCAELVAALDRGETARVEAEALRLADETAGLKFPFAFLLLHHVYERQQRWDRVEANLRRAVSTFAGNPAQSAVFQGNLAELYLARGEYGAAEAVATAMLAADPRQPRVLELLGRTAEARGDWRRALDLYRRAQAEERNNYALGKKVLQAHLKLGDRSAARETLEPLLAVPEGNGDPDLLFTAAMLFVDDGDDARAEALLARLVRIEPTAPRWFDYALLLARTGKMEQAVAGMEKALAAPAGQLDEERKQAALRALKAWKAERPR